MKKEVNIYFPQKMVKAWIPNSVLSYPTSMICKVFHLINRYELRTGYYFVLSYHIL